MLWPFGPFAMKNSFSRAFLLLAALAVSASSQSTSQDFPTAVTSSEISGTIKARDLGDSRLTTYYFALGGEQGDLFINLVTKNFTGDIDVFTANGLRPLTKIVVYADYGEAETGRAIYLRKPERLLLRIQGRTPNDDAATFRLKFAGSFAALSSDDLPTAPELPKVTGSTRGEVRVNSAGSIIRDPIRSAEAVDDRSRAGNLPTGESEQVSKEGVSGKPADDEAIAKPEVVVTDPLADGEKATTVATKTAPARNRANPRASRSGKVAAKASEKDRSSAAANSGEKPAEPAEAPGEGQRPDPPAGFRTLTDKRPKTAKPPVQPKVDPLESINLVIRFKDGRSLEKKMSEVFKFSVDKGILTVVLKDGSITRHPIIDVARVTIE